MPRRIPTYRLHKCSGNAVVTLGGKDFYLGRHGSPESHAEYRRLVAEWLAGGVREKATDRTVEEVLSAYWCYAEPYYGAGSSQADRVGRAIGTCRKLYGHTPAADFGPVALRACQGEMVRSGLCRRGVNQRIGCLKRAFKWAASEELISASIWHALQTIEGLKVGRSAAPDHPLVVPPPEASIAAVKAHVLPVLADVIELQLLTAMRPGEALAMRWEEVDRSGPVWVYRPIRHKTAYRGIGRVILIGPKAQALLTPYLHVSGYLFSPRRALDERAAALGQQPRYGRQPGERYRADSYGHAVRVACDRAGVERWHPHALRHAAATMIAKEAGFEVARIVLGHRTLDATRIYVEDDLQRALNVVGKVG